MLFDLKRSASVVGFFSNGVKTSPRIDINYHTPLPIKCLMEKLHP